MSAKSLTPRASASIDDEKQDQSCDVREPNCVAEGVDPAGPSPEITTDPGKGDEAQVTAAYSTDNDHEYITGVKLILVMAAVTLVCFLMLLDTSIITTVCFLLCVIPRH
jgi:hypothetical protein